MNCYHRIDESESIDCEKKEHSRECDICHFWYFLNDNFNYNSNTVCDGCHEQKKRNAIK